MTTHFPTHKKTLPPPQIPTQTGPDNIRWDFNNGARILFPDNEKTYAYRIENSDTRLVIIMGTHKPEKPDPTDESDKSHKEGEKRLYQTKQKYHMPLSIRVWELLKNGQYEEKISVQNTLKNRKVLIQFPRGALGDTLAWFPYAAAFTREHQCKTTIVMPAHISDIYRKTHPHIIFADPDPNDTEFRKKFFASYRVALFYNDHENCHQPRDFRITGLASTARNILDLSNVHDPIPPDPTIKAKKTDTPYVCIGTQSTMQAKYWNNPNGWKEVISFLKKSGYRVISIDRNYVAGHTSPNKNPTYNYIPNGCEDETGNRPLSERIAWLRGAAFFIGLSSGLSWLAKACDTPTIMISGFTDPSNEFEADARIWSPIPCNSCWNDRTITFDPRNYHWCPRHENTHRAWECSRFITAHQVISAITNLPAYKETAPQPQEIPDE